MKSVLIISPYKSFPPNHGSAHRIWNLFSSLSQSDASLQVDLLYNTCSTESTQDEIEKNKPQKTSRLIETKISPSHFFLRQNNWRLLRKAFSEIRTHDVILLEFPYFLGPLVLARLFRKTIIIDEHNVEFIFNREIYEKRFFLIRWIVLFLTGIVEWFSLHMADKVLCCSEHDKTELSNRYGISTQKCMVLPNAVDLTQFSMDRPKQKRFRRLTFVGSQDHYPNKIAIDHIAYQILPQLDLMLKEQQNPKELTMVFIGRNPPNYLFELSFTHITLEIKDSVDDIASELHTTDIALAPLFHGSGTRIKILEYLATGNLVIATTKAVEGLSFHQDKEYLLEDMIEQYATRIMDVVEHPKKYGTLIDNGKKSIQQRFDWNKNIIELKKYINSLQ